MDTTCRRANHDVMVMTLDELETKHPDAFGALPECYQVDDCLEFWEQEQGLVIFARPKMSELHALGNWCCYYRSCSFSLPKWRRT